MNKLIILFLSGIFSLSLISYGFSQTAKDHKTLLIGDLPALKVSKTGTTMQIDGKMDDAAWQKTESRSFDYYYNCDKPADQQKSTFRMLWDDKNLYLFFDCNDQYITARETNRDGEPYFDDCAEIFLIPVPDSLKMHFGFEINLYKTANDFVFLNGMNKGENVVIKAYNPDYKVAVTVNGTINDNSDIDTGWTMEMAIPLTCFRVVGLPTLQDGARWAFLALRQDRNDADGNRRATSTIAPIYGGGVHAPNRFGILEFLK